MPREVYLIDGVYDVRQPEEGKTFETIILTEAYINKFKSKDRATFELLHQLNRRTEGKVISFEYDQATTPAANPELLNYVKYP